jgi:hypothetical protein
MRDGHPTRPTPPGLGPRLRGGVRRHRLPRDLGGPSVNVVRGHGRERKRLASSVRARLLAERLVIAEKEDAGTMTQAEANAEIAKLLASANDQQRQRNLAVWAAMPRAVTCTATTSYTTTCY